MPAVDFASRVSEFKYNEKQQLVIQAATSSYAVFYIYSELHIIFSQSLAVQLLLALFAPHHRYITLVLAPQSPQR